MSNQPFSRTVRELAKLLKARGCIDASHSTVLGAVDKAAMITKDPITRILLAADFLEERGYQVHREPLTQLVHELQVKQQQRKTVEATSGRHARLLEGFRMPEDYSDIEVALGPRDSADRPFSMFHWWPAHRSLGVYGADLERRAVFVSHLIRSMVRSGARTVVPVRETSAADPRILAPAAEVVDLTETPGGMGRLMAELEVRILEGADDMIVLVDSRHGLEEADLDVVAERALHPESRIRVVYAESFALRGWTGFMDAMLDYGEAVLLGPAPDADLATFELPAGFEIPDAPGAGLYLAGDVMERFGAPESSSVYRDAHQANESWGPCGHRPAVTFGATPVPLLPGDALWFWGTDIGTGWVVDTTADHHGVLMCSREDPDQPTLWGDPGRRRLIISTAHGLREEYPWVTGPHDDLEAAPRGEVQVCEDVHDGRLRFSDDALRLDLRAVLRDGRMIWIDEG